MFPDVQTAPTPLVGTLHQPCSQGIAFHVAADSVEVLVILNRERLEPSLVHMPRTGGSLMSVPTLGMGKRQPAGEPREVFVFSGPDHKVPVVSHQTIAQQSHVELSDGFDKRSFERFKVFVFVEDRHPSVGSVENMVDQTAFCGSFWASHATKSRQNHCPASIKGS